MGNIETIFEGGGFIPVPKGNSNPGEPKPKEQDKLDETLDFVAKVVKTRSLETLGKSVEGGERTGVDVGKILQAQTDLLTSTMTQLTDMLKAKPEDPYFKHLEGELQAMKQRLEGGQVDPVVALTANMKALDEMTDMMKKRLGIGGEVHAQPSDMPNLLALESAKIEHDERRNQWQVEREERKHQWEVENKRWEQDYRLRVLEFSDSRKVKERAGDALDDLLGSVIDSLETERGAAATKGGVETPETPKVRIPKSFKCKECGSIIEVARDHDLATPIICKSCGADYMLEEMP